MHEALGEVHAQPRLSREEKDKASLSVDGVAYSASTRGAQSPLSHEAELGAQYKVRFEASLASPNQRALLSSVTSLLRAKLRAYPQVLIVLLMQLQHLRILIKSLTARLELKHSVVLITFAVT